MADGQSSHGTKVKIGNGASPETFTEIPLVGDIDYTPPKADEHDIPDQSDSDHAENFILGKLKGGTVTFSVSYNPAQATHLALYAANNSFKNFQVVHTGTPTETDTFAAAVSCELKGPENGARKLECSLHIKGKPVRS